MSGAGWWAQILGSVAAAALVLVRVLPRRRPAPGRFTVHLNLTLDNYGYQLYDTFEGRWLAEGARVLVFRHYEDALTHAQVLNDRETADV